MLSWLASIGIGSIVKQIAAAYVAKQNAETDQQRIEADERIKSLEARRDVLIAEAPSQINTLLRVGFALPVMVYYGKLFLWDKALGLGSTDPLSPELQEVAMIVIGFYFLHEVGMSVARTLKRR